ncbi:MAG: hypothetical protein U1D35_06485, partial [Paracoccaceae bacterium]|nr:hypothetical protein [Paracoccaceae bacterium]
MRLFLHGPAFAAMTGQGHSLNFGRADNRSDRKGFTARGFSRRDYCGPEPKASFAKGQRPPGQQSHHRLLIQIAG